MSEVAPGTDRVGIIEAGLDAQIGLLTHDEQQALGERLAPRFGWRTAGELAVEESILFTLDQGDYDLTVAALGDLGVSGKAKLAIPSFEESQRHIELGAYTRSYLGEHLARGDKPELTMHIPFSRRGFNAAKLVKAFDAKKEYPTWVWDDLWNEYTTDDHNSGLDGTALRAGVMLNDTTNPIDRDQPANDYGEAGLVYVNQTVGGQRASVKAEANEVSPRGIELDPATFTEYMVVQAKRRQAGLPLLDRPTVTRFVGYPEKNIDGNFCVPRASVDVGGRLGLRGSRVDRAWDDRGVRRVVRAA